MYCLGIKTLPCNKNIIYIYILYTFKHIYICMYWTYVYMYYIWHYIAVIAYHMIYTDIHELYLTVLRMIQLYSILVCKYHHILLYRLWNIDNKHVGWDFSGDLIFRSLLQVQRFCSNYALFHMKPTVSHCCWFVVFMSEPLCVFRFVSFCFPMIWHSGLISGPTDS